LFASRRRHTRSKRDWSSDVCSSDLLGNHRLNTLCKKLDVELTQHHRAIYDAEATAYLFWKLVALVEEENLLNHKDLNAHVGYGDSYQHARPCHCTILVQNEIGLKNFYKLLS